MSTIEELLPTADLEMFRARAGQFDAENRFFTEDFERLRELGYLAAAVPEERGGRGLSLSALVCAQRRLAAAAPATALGVNMHLVWTQVARWLCDRGDDRLAWVLDDAAAGEVFAFGISEAGNDAVLLDAQSKAIPDGDGFRVSGTKIFTTLSPVWTRLGVHARLADAPEDEPKLVFGFVRRESMGVRGQEDGGIGLASGTIRHPGSWNPLGMRATQSYTTELIEVPMLGSDVAAIMHAMDPSEPLILAIFSSFSLLTASVYAGIGDRAVDIATDASRARGRLDDPDTASRLTAAVLEHRAALDTLSLLARDVDDRAERDDWFVALAHARNLVTDEARTAVDTAMRLVGARGYQADAELARLYRDVLAGMFHPSSSRALARSVRGMLAGDTLRSE